MEPLVTTVKPSTGNVRASQTLEELTANSALMDITISRSVNLADVTKWVRLAMCVTLELDNVSVSRTLLVNIAKSARTDFSTIQLVHIVTATAVERWMKFAIKVMVSVCAVKAMEVLGVTSVFLATTTTRIAYHVTARGQEASPRFVT